MPGKDVSRLNLERFNYKLILTGLNYSADYSTIAFLGEVVEGGVLNVYSMHVCV